MKRRNRSAWHIILSSPVTLIAVLIVLAFLVRAAWGIHEKAVESAAKLDQAQAELRKLQASQEELSAQVADLSTEEGVEAALREKYRAVSPGESVAVIVDGDSGQATSSAAAYQTEPAPAASSWWQELLRLVGL